MRYSTRLQLFRLGLALIYGLIYGISYATFRNMWEFLNNEEIMWEFLNNEEMKYVIREAKKREREFNDQCNGGIYK